MAGELVLFDVCNTLYDSNTTFEFLRFVLRKRRPRKLRYLDLLTKKYSPLFIAWTLYGKWKGVDVVRQKAIALLAGLTRQELLDDAEHFYQQHLVSRKMQDVIERLDAAKEGNEVWLFSNSIEPVIETIARHHGVAYEATRLEYDAQQNFTGRISRDLSGRKKAAFIERFGTQRCISMMCSDNRSDADILAIAQRPVVVVYNSNEKKYWQSINPEFIEKY